MKPTIHKAILVVVLYFSVNQLFAEGEPIGARAASMGNASVSSTDIWSIFNNPAGMAKQSVFSAGVNYENRYLMKELGLKSAALVLPSRFGVLGLSFNQFGYSLYNENKIGLAYARSFGEILRIGVQLDYLSTKIAEGYEGANLFTFELGIQSTINDKISLGAYVFNPIGFSASQYSDEAAPIIARLGLTYNFTSSFSGIAEVEKNFETRASVRLGLEYLFQEKFSVRTGISTYPAQYTLGAGMQFLHFQFHIAGSMHQTLGVSTQAGIIFQLKKSRKDEK
jgi:hypothetical protein